MKQQVCLFLHCTLCILIVSGCDGRVSTEFDTLPRMDFAKITGGFSYEPLPPVEANKPVPKAPADPLKRPFTHTDPLDLPESEFVIAGSDTLGPVTQSMIDRFYKEGFRGVFRMNQSSTGVGIKALCRGENMDLVNASRKLKPAEETLCEQNGIEPVQIKIGYDPFVIITNKKNYWMQSVGREQLSVLFKSNRWSEVDPSYPFNPIAFYLPRKAGGAMDAMSELVYGSKDARFIRDVSDGHFYPYNMELTRDLENDTYGIGFASYSKLTKLKQLQANVIPVNGEQPVISGSAYPLKRSLFIITSTSALKKIEVQTFIAHYLNFDHTVMPPHGFAPLNGIDALQERRNFLSMLELATVSEVQVSLPPK